MSSKFNVDQFMSTVYTDSTSTESIPVPEGDYPGIATKLGLRTVDTKDGERVILEVQWKLQDNDGSIKAVTGREVNFGRQSIWLDLTSEGNIDMSRGMNIGLGLLRQALGQNSEGAPWNFRMIEGQPALCSVKHRVDKESGRIFHEVREVAAL